MATEGPGGKGTRTIRTSYPHVDGLIAGTTKQTGHITNLVPQLGSKVSRNVRIGMS